MEEEQLIPRAEELEWLEANNFPAEYEGEDGFPFNEEEIGEGDGDVQVSAALPCEFINFTFQCV